MLSPLFRLLSACLCLLTAAHAAEPLRGFIPITVSEGPLVCVIRPEDESGRPDGSLPRTEVMYVCEVSPGAKPQRAWSGDVPLVEPLERLTKDLSIVKRIPKCYLWDMAKGTATPLWPDEDQTTFLKYEGGRVFFLRRLIPDPLRGMKVKDGKDGKIVADNWFRPRDKLCTLTPGDKGAVELPAPVIEEIVENGPDGIWAITADEPRKLCLISNDGKATDIIPFDPHWVPRETHPAFSPARDYLALSVLHDEQDFDSERELIVVDVKQKAICHVSHNVPLGPYIGYPGPISKKWLNDSHLLFGDPMYGGWEKSRVLDAPSGKLSPASKDQFKAAWRPSGRERKGLFDSDFGKIWFAGDTEPAASILTGEHSATGDMEISKDGKWAAFCGPADKDTFLLDGGKRQKRKLIDGWAYNLKWLAAAEASK